VIVTTTNEDFAERPDYEGRSPERRALRRFLGVMAHFAGGQLTGTVVCADPRHNLFLNYDEMRALSKCVEWPEGLEFLSTAEGNVRALISGSKNRAAITRDFSGLCWRGEHRVDADGTVMYGIEWTLNGYNGAAWAGERHLDREISSANGHEHELLEIERRAPLAAQNLFKQLGRNASTRLTNLLSARDKHEKLLASPLAEE
jgi:hypothetical protein